MKHPMVTFPHFPSSSRHYYSSSPRKRGSRIMPPSQDSDTSDRRLRGGLTYRNDSKLPGRRIAKLHGFTLLEVMIALLVITLGMAAVINTTSESGWKSAQLSHKTIATWVAQNQIVKYRANRIWGTAKSQSGKVEMANIDWVWRMKISATDDPSLRRLDVEVFIDGEDALKARLTGFIAKI